MNSLQFLTEINKSISLINKDKIKIATKLFKNFKPKKSKVIIVGNGGNSSTANHASNDFTNYAKIEAVNFNDHNLITCFANDFGYENWVKKALSYYCKKKRYRNFVKRWWFFKKYNKCSQILYKT